MKTLLLVTGVLMLISASAMADQLSDQAKRDIAAAKSNPFAPMLVHGAPIGNAKKRSGAGVFTVGAANTMTPSRPAPLPDHKRVDDGQ